MGKCERCGYPFADRTNHNCEESNSYKLQINENVKMISEIALAELEHFEETLRKIHDTIEQVEEQSSIDNIDLNLAIEHNEVITTIYNLANDALNRAFDELI